MSNYDIFAKLLQLNVCKATRLPRTAYSLCHYRKRTGKWLGTNLIHGKNARFHGRVFKMCQISRKIHGRSFEKFTENSQAPQPLFRGAMLMQTKKSVE